MGNDILQLRLLHQQIASSQYKSIKTLVEWMGAIQAQDYAMSKWAVGVRLPGTTEKSVQQAFDEGDILRTHLLRPTWHLVSASDIQWMLQLTAPHIKAFMKFRGKWLGLTAAVIEKCNKIIEQALLNELFLTRDELIKALDKSGIKTRGDNLAAHIFMMAELEGLICSGKERGNKTTYALLKNRAPLTKTFSREKALSMLALKYFSSHGPATLEDFAWWSGLPIRDARTAIEMNDQKLAAVTIDKRLYWFSKENPGHFRKEDKAYLLPAYDEFIISYKDRSALLTTDHHKKAISSNGLFRPIILVNRKAAGTWKRTIKKDTVIIETAFFHSPDKKERNLIEEAAEKYGVFLTKGVEVKYE